MIARLTLRPPFVAPAAAAENIMARPYYRPW
jgi:hypothetical protein